MITRKKIALEVVILFYLLLIQGCDKVIWPVKVDDASNTFKLSEEKWGGNVIIVKVFDSTYTELLWCIKAVDKIPVKGFQIKVGEVPNGFEQTVPDKKTQFVLKTGVKYIILIKADFDPPAWGAENRWIAD